MHDNDGKYSKQFLASFAKSKIKTQRTEFRSPTTVAFVERFVQSVQQECLDHFVAFGHKHMDVLCSKFRDHYHTEQPHQGLDNELIQKHRKKKTSKKLDVRNDSMRLSDVRCHERLGGLLKSYSCKARVIRIVFSLIAITENAALGLRSQRRYGLFSGFERIVDMILSIVHQLNHF